jgi:hypothetical protein
MFQIHRAPRGATRGCEAVGDEFRFQSTAPARGATLQQGRNDYSIQGFKIHAPARGATVVFSDTISVA